MGFSPGGDELAPHVQGLRGFKKKICCVVFFFFLAWIHGDPRKVVYPTDSRGQFCGQQNTSTA